MFNIVERLRYRGNTIGYIVADLANNKRFINIEQASKLNYANAVVCSNGTIRGKVKIHENTVYDSRSWDGNWSGYFILFHGSPNKSFVPTYGLGSDKHDYGKGFYLTPHKKLAKEWAMCSESKIGYLHSYILRLDGLKVLDLNKLGNLAWMAELMKHRKADTSLRYRRFSPVFIEKYSVCTDEYDIIHGWRADSSFFSLAKRFVRDEIDYELIGELFKLGDLENQICLKSQLAFDRLFELPNVSKVDIKYADLYNKRDKKARELMDSIIDSPMNTMTNTFSTLIK